MKKLLIILILFCSVLVSHAQEFQLFSQYVTNGLILNPAYTGSREVLSLNMAYRNQTIGVDNTSSYQTLSAHAPLKNANIGLGFLLLNAQEGVSRNTQAYFNYAYRVHLGAGRLALGLRAGFHFGEKNQSNYRPIDIDDPEFLGKTSLYTLPNLGAGAYYYSRRFFAGFSVPYILSIQEKSTNNGYTVVNDPKNYNFLFTSGYLIDIARGFKMKPTALLKYYMNSPTQLDLNLHLILLNDRLWLGAAYRKDAAYAALLDLQFNPQFRLSYSFEYGNKLTGNDMSHEIGLRYEFSYKIKAFNPRYF